MALLLHKPAPPLSDFIETVWHFECHSAPNRMERILPSGNMGIIVNLRGDGFRVHEDYLPGAIISGAHSEFITLDTAQQAYTLGIEFKPGGATPFLKIPAGELQGQHVALNEVWGDGACELHERLLAASDAGARFLIVDEILLDRIGQRRAHPAVTYAVREIGRTQSISELASKISLSPRRFADIFRNEVGLTPKLFCRIRRFQQALRRLSEGKHLEWAEFALANGYYDQSHFIHDFKAFSGLNPSSYMPRERGFTNHVALLD